MNAIYKIFCRKPLLEGWWCVGICKTYQFLDICFKFLQRFLHFLYSCFDLGGKNFFTCLSPNRSSRAAVRALYLFLSSSDRVCSISSLAKLLLRLKLFALLPRDSPSLLLQTASCKMTKPSNHHCSRARHHILWIRCCRIFDYFFKFLHFTLHSIFHRFHSIFHFVLHLIFHTFH